MMMETDATSAGFGEGGGVEMRWPLPPMQYVCNYSRDKVAEGTAPAPPPPIHGLYRAFGNAHNTEEDVLPPLASLNIKTLYNSSLDPRAELKHLNRSLIAAFLVGTAPAPPPPIHGLYRAFGNAHNTEEDVLPPLASLNIKTLYNSSLDPRAELKHLNRSLIAAFLVGTAPAPPPPIHGLYRAFGNAHNTEEDVLPPLASLNIKTLYNSSLDPRAELKHLNRSLIAAFLVGTAPAPPPPIHGLYRAFGNAHNTEEDVLPPLASLNIKTLYNSSLDPRAELKHLNRSLIAAFLVGTAPAPPPPIHGLYRAFGNAHNTEEDVLPPLASLNIKTLYNSSLDPRAELKHLNRSLIAAFLVGTAPAPPPPIHGLYRAFGNAHNTEEDVLPPLASLNIKTLYNSSLDPRAELKHLNRSLIAAFLVGTAPAPPPPIHGLYRAFGNAHNTEEDVLPPLASLNIKTLYNSSLDPRAELKHLNRSLIAAFLVGTAPAPPPPIHGLYRAFGNAHNTEEDVLPPLASLNIKTLYNSSLDPRAELKHLNRSLIAAFLVGTAPAPPPPIHGLYRAFGNAHNTEEDVLPPLASLNIKTLYNSSLDPRAELKHLNRSLIAAFLVGTAPAPPPPIHGLYRAFGNAHNTEEDVLPPLASLNIKTLYNSSLDPRAELKHLNRSLIAAFLDLLEILVRCPESGDRIRKLEDIRLLFINIHHLINEYRPRQARETLRVLLSLQVSERKEAKRRFEAHFESVRHQLSDALSALPSSPSLPPPLLDRLAQLPTSAPATGGELAVVAGTKGKDKDVKADAVMAANLDDQT